MMRHERKKANSMAGIPTARRYIFPEGRFTLGMRASRIIQHSNAYLLIAAFLFLALLPVFWMFANAFKTLEQMRITFPIQWFPNPVTFENFADGWRARDWLLHLRNTLMLAVFVLIPTMASCILAAYAFARMRFPGSELLIMVNVSLMLMPDFVTMVPRYVMMARMGWVGTWLPAIIPSMLALNPAMVFVLRQFFRAIPNELSEAARLDGCNDLVILWRVIIPLAKPILALQVVLITSWAWNDLLFPLLYLKDKSMQTITLAMMGFIGSRGDTQWGPMMAMSVLVSLPMMALSYYGQRYFTEGFTLTGIKG